MHEYNDSSLLSKIYFSKEYGRIVIFIYNFKKNNFLMFKLKYELIIHKWLKTLYNFLTLIVFFLMEISKTESAEISYSPKCGFFKLISGKNISLFNLLSLIQRKGNFIIFYQTYMINFSRNLVRISSQ